MTDAFIRQARRPNLERIICRTPLAKIKLLYKGEKRVIYTKLETFNMTGSIKDRVALHVIKRSYQEGMLKEGNCIVEATSGNTGISFAAVGAAFNHPVCIYMPDWMSEERIRLIKSFGAQIHLVTKEEGGFLGSIELTRKHKEENPNTFLPRQFENEFNVEAHYQSTGPEIEEQMRMLGEPVNAFVAGVGTGGTVMGTGKYLREVYPNIKIHPLEPANSPTLKTGKKVGKHRIQGISDEFVPPIVHLDELDEIIDVDDGDAIIMAQKLATQLGLGVGISSGANFLGAIIAQDKLRPESNVVTILCDSNKKYLTTDLCKEEPIKQGFISSDVELLNYSLVS